METAKDEMEKRNKKAKRSDICAERCIGDEKSRMDTARKEWIKEGEDRVSRLNLLLIGSGKRDTRIWKWLQRIRNIGINYSGLWDISLSDGKRTAAIGDKGQRFLL